MTHGSLFSGIGGFDLAAEWMGWENLFHCEWNEFGQKVLNHYWPDAELFTDITKSDFTKYANRIDILSGGFPCQPYSMAGKRKGKEDERHLWPEMLRAIREIQPTWVVGENVSGLINWSGGLVFHEVQTDLEAEGYEVQPFVLPAAGVGSCPHRRDRVWFIAYSKDNDARRKQSKCCERKNSTQIGGRLRNEFAGDGFNGITPDTRLQRQAERQQQAMGIEQLCEKQPTTNPTSNRRERNGQGIEIEKGLQPGPESAGQLERGFEGLCNTGDVADTESQSSRWQLQQQQGQGEFGGCDSIGDVADTGHTGLQGGKVNGSTGGSGQESDKLTTGCVRSNWQNFPTQSPICSRNDGLSSRLDNITFSKWRNESIKAAGNAIVPQVVLMIFEAIQQMATQQKL
jgi:DNA (cytosine-5)-methyltransferase 1